MSAQFYDQNGELRLDGTLVGGGTTGGAGIYLVMSGAGLALIDLAVEGGHLIAFDQAYADTYSGGPITDLPAGIGFTLALDGSSGTLTTTEAGVWWFSIAAVLVEDATLGGQLGISNADITDDYFGPAIDSTYFSRHPKYGTALALPEGAQVSFIWSILSGATASPYHPNSLQATVVRLT